MSYTVFSKSNDLRTWADSLEARQKLPALVRKLIHATVQKPSLSQFPADEGIQRRGWDGILEVVTGNAWVPNGRSVWEIGVDQDPEAKATGDYNKRTENPGTANISELTFVFVTPRKWEGKTKWLQEKRAESNWLDVRVLDCDDIEQWLETAPSVDAWLARLLGKLPAGVRDLSSYWLSLAATSEPPLTPSVFMAGRSEAAKALKEALAEAEAEIAISALSLAELRDFVSAVLASSEEENDGAMTARALVVETVDAWNHLSTTKNRLLLIPGDQLALEKQMVAEAVKAGHHVITQRPYTLVRGNIGIRVPRADRWELEKALKSASFQDERASRLARETGGSVRVLVRLASKFAGQATPEWSKPNEVAPLLPLVLLGAWADNNEADRKLIERFTGQPYSNIQQVLTRWMNHADAPLRLAESTYSFVSREDSWQLLNPAFSTDLLNRFYEIGNEVLGEDDPRFEMPANERYLATIYKKLPKFSPQLREGVAETVALLGTRGTQSPRGSLTDSCWRAARLVGELLNDATPRRWFSLASNLPLLAEASPDEFLSALESDLRKPMPAIATLFEKDADGFFSKSPHTSLMWALELLVWDVAYLSRVVLVLAALIKLDTGGRINPRPAGVMFDIFRFWFPQTSATIDERLQVLELLSKREPDIAWTLLLGLIPSGPDTAMASIKPRWRECDSSQTRQITNVEIQQQAEWAAARLVKIAEAHREKWLLLLKEFRKLPIAVKEATLKWLRALNPESISEDARTALWSQLRNLVQEHRFFHDAWWALPKETVNALEEMQNKLSPTSPIVRSKWLFESGTFHAFGDTETPWEDRERMQSQAQMQAVREIFGTLGLDGLLQLGSKSEYHYCTKVGDHLAKSGLLPDWKELLPDKFLSEEQHERAIALGYAAGRRSVEGDEWTANLPLNEWPAESVATLALILNFDCSTWQMLRRRRREAENFYWQKVNPWGVGHLSESELEEAVTAFLQRGRAMIAIQTISLALHNHKKPNWKTVADAVELAASLPADPVSDHTMTVFYFTELMKYLESHPNKDQKRLATLEWALLPLARHDRFEPKLLHTELSQNPEFFVEVISAVYRAKDEPKDQTPDQRKQNLAEAGHMLLESWANIPGVKSDGQVDAKILSSWVSEARKLCAISGRVEICDLKIGEQLSCAPSDSDTSWPCEAVRDVIEAVPTDEILRGFALGVYNQRGVTSRGLNDGGEQERVLAKKYRAHAEKFKVLYPRTSMALRRIADHYEVHAKWEDERAEARN